MGPMRNDATVNFDKFYNDNVRFPCHSRTHPYSTLTLGVFPLDQIADGGNNRSMHLKLFSREITFKVFQRT